MNDASTLILPQLAPVYDALWPAAAALLRAVVGLALVPHALRFSFGCFPNSGSRALSIGALAAILERSGYRPGKLWAVVTILIEFIAGPLLALGLFTRPAALIVFIFLLLAAIDHGRNDGYFWNTLGFEYPFLWAVAALVFVVCGGGLWSLDHLLIGREF
jgi:putative oxidoreductase